MQIVRLVLILLGAGCFYLAYTYLSVLPSERAKARHFRSLEEDGVEARARLVSLRPHPGDRRGLAVLELQVPGADPVRFQRHIPITPDTTVGGPYPVVRHRQFPDRVEPGDKAAMARQRRHHESYPRTAWRWTAAAVTLGAALALTGGFL